MKLVEEYVAGNIEIADALELVIDAWFENRPLNYETLLAIHGYIFGDLYPWAGQLRTIDIFKEEEVLGGVSLKYGETS